ncbi:peptidase inhibitor family I36 protein [Streptomyces oceani]|uniref:Proteinase inhibitor I36 SMPI n=1 Tax=Streptomyces oceani TaxID=1075402 RepID=A0A1E7KG32_9ACTN|nr:peptidase inhibitor family I36 protein [Streptomyces oceani]OEV02881.1 hypothetical protein AN216_13850 [Streptomyces oceani]
MTSGLLFRFRSPVGVAALTTAVLAAAVVTGNLALPGQATAQAQPRAVGTELGDCDAGKVCLWAKPSFEGKRLTYELAKAGTESCVRLPGGFAADAYANRTGRPVTTYQSAECATTGEFDTHPGGSWTPESGYQVRAFKIWEH